MSLGKTVKIGYEWKRISLTDEERQRVLQALVEINSQEFKRCLETAKKISKEDYFNIAVVLFDKQGLAAYTALTEALEIKIHRLKNTPEDKKIEREASEKADKQLATPPPAPPKPEEKTPLDKTFEEVQGKREEMTAIKNQVGEPNKADWEVSEDEEKQLPRDYDQPEEIREIDLPEPDKQSKKESQEAANEIFGKEWDSEQGKLVSKKKPSPSHPEAFKEV